MLYDKEGKTIMLYETDFKGVKICIDVPTGNKVPVEFVPEWVQFAHQACFERLKLLIVENNCGEDFRCVNLIAYFEDSKIPLKVEGYLTWGKSREEKYGAVNQTFIPDAQVIVGSSER